MEAAACDDQNTQTQALDDTVQLVEFSEGMLEQSRPLLLACLLVGKGSGPQLASLQAVAMACAHRLQVAVLDLSSEKKFRTFFRIMGTPTYIVLQKGRELDRMLGKADEKKLQLFIHQVLGADF